ncbi:MAG: alpha-D-ribose 1-methylphosphonate 5-triphosphate diphosphatase [Verrucomicrobiota bacterium]
MNVFTLTHAKVVAPDTVLEDEAVVIEDGRIASIGGSVRGKEWDLSGEILIPGLIDLHCDAIEKEVEPRPGVLMPAEFAIRQIDTRNLMAGITTIYHCFSFAGKELGVRDPELATKLARQVHQMRSQLSVRNLIHARFEVSHPEAAPLMSGLMKEGVIEMLSFMDHSPGQGQFRDDGDYLRFLMKTYHKTEQEAAALIQAKAREESAIRSGMETLAEQANASGIRLISHDDDTPEKVRQMYDIGVRVIEFPINLETGIEARKLGMHALVGAPNVVRGRSQSKGVSALEAILADAANCLCSDYIPAAILPAVFRLAECLEGGLAEAAALATVNPAEAAGLTEHGRIAEDMTADLISVRMLHNSPIVSNVWVNGIRKLNRS